MSGGEKTLLDNLSGPHPVLHSHQTRPILVLANLGGPGRLRLLSSQPIYNTGPNY